jgi:hypothetical protein
MSRRRFYVAVCHGTLINPEAQRHHNGPLGLSAHVLDRVLMHATMATYRSEDGGPGKGRRLGIDGAIAEARKTAAKLNAWDRAQQ